MTGLYVIYSEATSSDAFENEQQIQNHLYTADLFNLYDKIPSEWVRNRKKTIKPKNDFNTANELMSSDYGLDPIKIWEWKESYGIENQLFIKDLKTGDSPYQLTGVYKHRFPLIREDVEVLASLKKLNEFLDFVESSQTVEALAQRLVSGYIRPIAGSASANDNLAQAIPNSLLKNQTEGFNSFEDLNEKEAFFYTRRF